MEIHNPHDRFIREYLTEKENTVEFLRTTLPESLANILNLEEIEILPGTFIDEQFQEQHADMLFRVPLLSMHMDPGDGVVEVYVLFEHKSGPDPELFRQLLGYLAHIYRRQERPVPVIPFVFHQGTAMYSGPRRFSELFLLDEMSRDIISLYLPDFSIALFNLPAVDLEVLAASLGLRVILEVMGNIRGQDLLQQLERIFSMGRPLFYDEKGLELLRKVLLYIYGSADIEPGDLKKIITASVSAEKGDLAVTTLEKVLKQGIEQGVDKGKLEVARKMIAEGLDMQLIQRLTGLSEKVLREIGNGR